ncbi:MAG: hypothetical protein GWO08_11630, partial [Gammaproteobacteria bacterium]|nr:hypothetical protein [Gammaproteobacteria bacterium]NIR94282.1 hypothetical protein [Gammaproteobacteria bacterium]
ARLTEGTGSSSIAALDITGTTVSWQKSPIVGTEVNFQYRVLDATQLDATGWDMSDGSWSSVVVSEGSTHYSVSLSGASNDRYQYRITYTRPGESQVYAAGA